MISFQVPEKVLSIKKLCPTYQRQMDLCHIINASSDGGSISAERKILIRFGLAFISEPPIQVSPSPHNFLLPNTKQPVRQFWFKSSQKLPDHSHIHQKVLA